MKNLATFVHSLFCNKTHLQEMEQIRKNKNNPDVCLFYLEQIIENSWELRDHKVWEKKAEKLVKMIEVSSPGEAVSLLNQSLAITRAASPLIQQHPQLKKLLIELIEVM
jgi:hypothetical protein